MGGKKKALKSKRIVIRWLYVFFVSEHCWVLSRRCVVILLSDFFGVGAVYVFVGEVVFV